MSFKISYYTTYSEPIKDEHSRHKKRVIFSSRTGQGLVVTDFLLQKLLTGSIDEIPLQTFLKLCSYEIIVPKREDEIKVIVDRRIAESQDIRIVQYSISMSQLKNGLEENEFIKNLKTRKSDFVLIHLFYYKGDQFEIMQLNEVIEKLHAVEKRYNWSFSFKVTSDFRQQDLHKWSELIIDHNIKEFEFRIYNNDCYNNEQFEEILRLSKSNEVNIIFRFFLPLHNSERYIDIVQLISAQKYNKFLILFSSDESLSKAEYARMEIFWLTRLRVFGVDSEYLPSADLGVFVIPTNQCGQIVSGSPFELFDSAETIGSNLVLRDFSDKDFEFIKSGAIPCLKCKVLPFCGGASKDAWSRFGEKLCPSYLENLKQRALLVYQKAQHQIHP